MRAGVATQSEERFHVSQPDDARLRAFSAGTHQLSGHTSFMNDSELNEAGLPALCFLFSCVMAVRRQLAVLWAAYQSWPLPSRAERDGNGHGADPLKLLAPYPRVSGLVALGDFLTQHYTFQR